VGGGRGRCVPGQAWLVALFVVKCVNRVYAAHSHRQTGHPACCMRSVSSHIHERRLSAPPPPPAPSHPRPAPSSWELSVCLISVQLLALKWLRPWCTRVCGCFKIAFRHSPFAIVVAWQLPTAIHPHTYTPTLTLAQRHPRRCSYYYFCEIKTAITWE